MSKLSSKLSKKKIIRTCCPAHNCGGRCVLVAHLEDGVITRLDADDRTYDEIDKPRLVACSRGRAYLRRQYHPDRLQYPLRRSGRRGEGKFERIGWDEALGQLADEIRRVREKYGNSALFVPYGTGSSSATSGSHLARRLLYKLGGCLDIYNSYSWACTNLSTPTVYGTLVTGNQRQDWLNSKYIIMWGWNPAEMIDGTNSAFYVKKARENGARVVCIDPRKTMSAVGLADEWVPVRPGTDVALMSAMAYVMLTEDLCDLEFIRTHCIGFDKSQMPPGLEDEQSYTDYILGTRDGIPKTPDWAQPITTVPAENIARIAREYATSKPAILYQGYGMQRRAYGEQVVRAGCVLAAITGNVGIPGGWASGVGLQAPDGGSNWAVMPLGDNPVKASIPAMAWDRAVTNGKGMGKADGVQGVEQLDNDIKLIYAVATNCLVNQHMDINKTSAMLADENLVEFIAVQDQFITPTARYADIILPACTAFETYGLQDGWKYGDEVILMPKLVEPLGETKSDFRICADLARLLGVEEEFTEGRDERQWVDHVLSIYRKGRFPDIPGVDEFEADNIGVHQNSITKPAVALADFRRDPVNHPLDTPSGKIEIFSKELHDADRPDEIPSVPKYVEEWESPFGKEAQKYPLQVLSTHSLHRVHSTHADNDWLDQAFPQRLFINQIDAKTREIEDGDIARVFNDRGEVHLPCRVTTRILPGVVDIPQGAWWTPDDAGVDQAGSVNVLTSNRLTPFAFGNAQHTIMAQVVKAKK